jgi:hypothetical protein
MSVRLSHVVDAHERGGRFGEDVLSVKCRFCGRVWRNEAEFSAKRIGDKPCPKRRGSTPKGGRPVRADKALSMMRAAEAREDDDEATLTVEWRNGRFIGAYIGLHPVGERTVMRLIAESGVKEMHGSNLGDGVQYFRARSAEDQAELQRIIAAKYPSRGAVDFPHTLKGK